MLDNSIINKITIAIPLQEDCHTAMLVKQKDEIT